MFKRILSTVLLVVMVLTTVACSNKETSGSSVNADAKKEETSKQEKDLVELIVLSDGAVNLGAGELSEQIKEKEKEIAQKESGADGLFQLEFSTYLLKQAEQMGMVVRYEDWGWAEELIQKQTAAFLAKQGPDIIIGETQSPGFANQGVLEEFPDWLDLFIRENIAPGAWKPMEVDGKIYGVAVQPGVNNLYWNKDILRKAGVNEDIIERGPQNWDEWLAVSEQIAAAGKGEYYAGGCYAGPNFGGYLRFGALMQINGGGFVGDNNEPIFNSPSNVHTVDKLVKEMSNYNPEGLLVSPGEGAFFDAFSKGQIAYIVDGPWRIQISKDQGMDVGSGALPLSKNGKPGNVTIGAAFLSVPHYAKNKEEAFKYIQKHLEVEAQKIIAEYKVRPVVNKTIGEKDEYRLKNPELYNVYKELAGDVKGLPTYNKEGTKVWQEIGNAIVKSAVTDKATQEVLDEAQDKANKLLK